ncbi:MAG: GH92 family glycosyl hydrolase [Bacteroidales bacterium]|jgi:predicted alpha-1,2-mannosidase|nr:GH92 family glycosyl hydrolase [Bacteroidales bacterium]
MKNYILSLFLIFSLIACKQSPSSSEDVTKYVDPFIGTAYNGHTFPGATVPFGFIQASPETGNDAWKYCSGYNCDDTSIIGFAQNHLNGTGCSDLGDVLMLPFAGERQDGDYRSTFAKAEEKATPGYYAVRLSDTDIDVELTATQRTAMHRYTFRKDAPAYLLLDLQSGVVWNAKALEKHVLAAEMQMPDNRSITGHQQVVNWVNRHYYYAIQFDHPYTVAKELPAKEGNNAKRLILAFDLKAGEQLQAKIALSTVDVDGALASLQKENPAWDFETVRDNASRQWNELLSRVQVSGNDDQKKNFYTSLYHLYIQPNNIADTDGRYRGVDDSVRVSPSGAYYSTLSLWDTYRAAHPLYTILIPEKVDGFVQSMLAHQKVQGYLPIWTLWGKENYCMIANHAIPVVVDAYLKGFTGFCAEDAFQAVKASSQISHPRSNWELYTQYGYYPFDLFGNESVSYTLESAYDDYCVAAMAKAMGKTDDDAYFSRRAAFYKNLFDPQTKLARGKDSKGNWRTPFNSVRLAHDSSSGGDYTEGNAWQYTWHVQHDVEGLIALMGGKEAFADKLDSLFFLEAPVEKTGFVSDVTGLIGQYAHGNEPSHHVAYLYNYVDKPQKTQELIREIFDRFYLNKPDGLCGNDDCGQMSAWYVFSAMGFYPVDPISGEYVLGAPQVPKVVLSLADGKTFTMEALNLSAENKYVESVTWNGQPFTSKSISHKAIMNGGQLVFNMTN